MELWIPITIAAAFLQNLRSMVQKHLKGVMGTTGATFVRFGFGVPFAIVFLLLLHLAMDYPVPALNARFALWALLGGLAQIAATFLLLYLFSFRNFAVGTAYSRTEPAQAALFGLIFLGERASAGVIAAIAISVFGVMLISVAPVAVNWRSILSSMGSRNSLIGLASGMFFGISGVSYRAASLSLEGPNFMMQAAVTLLFVIIVQSIIMFGWMLWREPAEIGRVVKAWKPALFTGLVGASASFGWFMAMTLQQAAVVKSLAQIEMLFTFAATIFFFKEKISPLEIAGCVLIVGGILTLLAFG